MSNSIPKVSLEDSLYVLQLARETALAQNRQAQAKRMTPVVEEMRGLVTNAASVEDSSIHRSDGTIRLHGPVEYCADTCQPTWYDRLHCLGHGTEWSDRCHGAGQYV